MIEFPIRPYSFQEFRLYSVTRACLVGAKGNTVRGFPSTLSKDSRDKTVKAGTPFIEFRDLSKGYREGIDESEGGKYTHAIGGGTCGRVKLDGKKSKPKSMFFKFRFSPLNPNRAFAEYMPRTNEERNAGIKTGERDAVLIEVAGEKIRVWFFRGLGAYSAELFSQWEAGRLCTAVSDGTIAV